MAIDIKTLAQAELAKIILAHPTTVVTVVNGENSAQCIRDMTMGEADLGEMGEAGETTGKVYGNADTLGTITNGQTITVGDSAANVMNHDTDPAGAITTIDYTLQKPK